MAVARVRRSSLAGPRESADAPARPRRSRRVCLPRVRRAESGMSGVARAAPGRADGRLVAEAARPGAGKDPGARQRVDSEGLRRAGTAIMTPRHPLVLVPQYFGCLVFDRRTSRYLPFDHEATRLLLRLHRQPIDA